jgi:hypothetical protein
VWWTWFTATTQQVIVAELHINGQVLQTGPLRVLGSSAGVDPFFLDIAASVAGGQLVSQDLKVATPMSNGSTAVLYVGQPSRVLIPLLDRAGQG